MSLIYGTMTSEIEQCRVGVLSSLYLVIFSVSAMILFCEIVLSFISHEINNHWPMIPYYYSCILHLCFYSVYLYWVPTLAASGRSTTLVTTEISQALLDEFPSVVATLTALSFHLAKI